MTHGEDEFIHDPEPDPPKKQKSRKERKAEIAFGLDKKHGKRAENLKKPNRTVMYEKKLNLAKLARLRLKYPEWTHAQLADDMELSHTTVTHYIAEMERDATRRARKATDQRREEMQAQIDWAKEEARKAWALGMLPRRFKTTALIPGEGGDGSTGGSIKGVTVQDMPPLPLAPILTAFLKALDQEGKLWGINAPKPLPDTVDETRLLERIERALAGLLDEKAEATFHERLALPDVAVEVEVEPAEPDDGLDAFAEDDGPQGDSTAPDDSEDDDE